MLESSWTFPAEGPVISTETPKPAAFALSAKAAIREPASRTASS
jgi:hypothetical protein